MKQNNMLAMILAGGRGSRLHDLTKKVAKPAVSYGGKYRIIDFPLSNCANSGIDVVGVLTQYESVLLNSYVAAGRRWGLDAKDSGVFVLPPREKSDADLNVYRGTADAISQNIDFIDSYSPEYLLILSGDHIYKMNYAKMLAYHKETQSDAMRRELEDCMSECPCPTCQGRRLRKESLAVTVGGLDIDTFCHKSVTQALDFVEEKEQGLDTMVLQGGKNFSGGQKQRLTIARALVKDPEILILDDSASALDYATDASLRKAIRNLNPEMTVFIVSQRAASVWNADQIIVLDDGEMVGLGTHQELLAGCAVYQEIYYSQFQREEA